MVYTSIASTGLVPDRHIAFTPPRTRRSLSFWERCRRLAGEAKTELIGWLAGLVTGLGLWYGAQSRGDQVTANAIAWALLAVALGGLLFVIYVWRLEQ